MFFAFDLIIGHYLKKFSPFFKKVLKYFCDRDFWRRDVGLEEDARAIYLLIQVFNTSIKALTSKTDVSIALRRVSTSTNVQSTVYPFSSKS